MDKPVTDAELDQFYGIEATEIEIAMTIGAASSEYADTFEEGENSEEFRKQWIADAASVAIYGRTGVVKAHEVKV